MAKEQDSIAYLAERSGKIPRSQLDGENPQATTYPAKFQLSTKSEIVSCLSLAERDLSLYPLFTEEQNIAAGVKIRALRTTIAQHVERAGINLSQVEPENIKDKNLRYLLVELHSKANELALGNWDVAVGIAKAKSRLYQAKREEGDDLFQVGFEQLIKAAYRYNPLDTNHSMVDFRPYANKYVAGGIIRAHNSEGNIRIPTHQKERVNHYHKIEKYITQVLGTEPDEDTIMFYLRVYERNGCDHLPTDDEAALYQEQMKESEERHKFRRFCRKTRRFVGFAESVSLNYLGDEYDIASNHPTSDPDDIARLSENISDTEQFSAPENETDTKLLRAALEEAFEGISDKEKEVLEHRFGLTGQGPQTLEETGQFFGLTDERIRQIQAQAFRKLRHPFRRRSLQPYLRS